ncbi:MAG: SDR family oxidoreductase [Chloroflexi bacterium]|nr:SDR family oxidoreductase [Chloroflexota bacterium]
MDLGIRGRRAVVGGATAGLGAAIAAALAAEGCDLVLTARRGDVLADMASGLSSEHGVRASAVAADFLDRHAAAQIAAHALDAFGGVDILVLNAGGPPPVDPSATNAAGWRRAFQMLALTPIDLATRLLPGMRERGWGRIVAVGSYSIRQPVDDLAYSNGGRSALMAWMKTASRAVAADGVTLNGAFPGRHATARIEHLDRLTAERTGRAVDAVRADHLAAIPMRRYGEPAEFAGYVAYLCSDRASYQTGTFTTIDGGLLTGFP